MLPFERTRGYFDRAIANYTASLRPFRDLKFEISQARSLNDRAFVLASVGDSVAAEASVKDALELRLRLGYGYPIALSLNTYGIVMILSERPVSGEDYCLRALAIFRRVDHEYGQMLAHRALSEAYRRDAGRLPLAHERHLQQLTKALEESKQSFEIATRLLQPPNSVLADILDEYGCVYRDLARHCWQNPEECKGQYEADGCFNEAERLLKESIDAVKDITADDRRADSLINLAYLYFWRKYSVSLKERSEDDQKLVRRWLDAAETSIKEAIDCIPERYRDPSHGEHPQSGELTIYWTFLNKAWALTAQIAQERRLLAERAGELSAEDKGRLEDELASAAIRILYFADQLPGDVRAVRRARISVYDVLKPLASETLERFREAGENVFPEEERGKWQTGGVGLFQKYLELNFGIE